MVADFFNGYAINAVDAKNRLSVPSNFRTVSENRSQSKTIVLGPSPRGNYIVGYDLNQFARIQAKLEDRFGSDYSDDRDDASRLEFGLCETLPYDETGRVILPKLLKSWAGIAASALFVGQGQFFEIWNPLTLLEQKGGSGALGHYIRSMLGMA